MRVVTFFIDSGRWRGTQNNDEHARRKKNKKKNMIWAYKTRKKEKNK